MNEELTNAVVKAVQKGPETQMHDKLIMSTAQSILEILLQNTDFAMKSMDELMAKHSNPAEVRVRIEPLLDQVYAKFRKVLEDAKINTYFFKGETAEDAEYTIEDVVEETKVVVAIVDQDGPQPIGHEQIGVEIT